MTKKINTKLNKLIKYYSLINHNLIYDNFSINRFKDTSFNVSGNKASLLLKLKKNIDKIKNCELKKNALNQVFADGNPDAKIMIIGEGPGANEDKEGKPFVGRAGKLLSKMLEAIQLDRSKVYITNVVNYRPPENRKPTEEEITRYLPYLKSHIDLISNILDEREIWFPAFNFDFLKKGIFEIENSVCDRGGPLSEYYRKDKVQKPLKKKKVKKDKNKGDE